MKERVYLSSPHMCGEEMKYVNEAFETNWIAPLGKNVDNFENETAEYIGVKYAAATVSGTSAIHLALKRLGVGMGDYVFCSSLTFSGSCNPIAYEKAIPVFVDAEPETFNMSPIALEKAFVWAKKHGKMPKAVIIVDLYGTSANYNELLPICKKYGVPVIEDAAEALGASYNGKKCGSFGQLSILSFNGNKIITTSGGGMLLSNDDAAIKKARFWSTQSRDAAPHYQHTEIGYNYRMSNICAGIGRGQLTALNRRVAQKTAIHKRYVSFFAGTDFEIIEPPAGTANYWLTLGKINGGKITYLDIIDALSANNIEARPIWKPMNLQPVFAASPFFSHYDEENARSAGEDLFNSGICLPSDTKMTEDTQNRVMQIIKELF
jgi:pyridoxal phosphate-dependent aminotransferase EpsN